MFKLTQPLFKTQALLILCSSRNKAAAMNLEMTRDWAGTFTKIHVKKTILKKYILVKFANN